MLTSVKWLNKYLDPGGLGPDAVAAALERAGFPIEGLQDRPGPDAVLDVELTSNRGDCMCHAGLAREVAAATGQRFRLPEIPFDIARGPGASANAADVFDVVNNAPDACPRFTARVIRGVKVGPSPAWMVDALEAVGQRSVNNIVDASNYILFELGQPTHTFDLATLRGSKIVVRWAKDGEPLAALDGRSHTLRSDELVVADGERAVSIAGVIGGAETAVTERTTDILLEAATWAPAVVRRAARRLRITTDAGKRFERFVDPRTIDFAAARLAAIILDIAGGELLGGAIDRGEAPVQRTVIDLRPRRCDRVLGIVVPPMESAEHLRSLGIEAELSSDGERVRCVVPPHRPDLTREIDLIEEVARVHGLDRVPIRERVEVEVRPIDAREAATRTIANTLTGLGFYETVTFSFVREDEAAAWMPGGMRVLKVDEERRRGEPALRPSVIPSLLRCRAVNQDAGVAPDGGARLFETASVFAETDDGQTVENRNLALFIDAADEQRGWREMRGVIEAAVHALAGPAAKVHVEPAPSAFAACRDDAFAGVRVNGRHVGYMALVTDATREAYGLRTGAVVAEINLGALVELSPPVSRVAAAPEYPAIERDLSVVVDEATPWAEVERVALGAEPALLEELRFVGVYRGKQVGAGKKSVTLRLVFRDPSRTLRHEEVDPQVSGVVGALAASLGATLRE